MDFVLALCVGRCAAGRGGVVERGAVVVGGDSGGELMLALAADLNGDVAEDVSTVVHHTLLKGLLLCVHMHLRAGLSKGAPLRSVEEATLPLAPHRIDVGAPLHLAESAPQGDLPLDDTHVVP